MPTNKTNIDVELIEDYAAHMAAEIVGPTTYSVIVCDSLPTFDNTKPHYE